MSKLDIPRLLIAITAIAVLTMATRVPASPDMWWHLRCGAVQWQARAVLKQDIFSHTAAGTPWVNQSWLPQLAMYGLYTFAGFPALALSVAALATVTSLFVLWNVHPPGRYGPFWRAAVVIWAAISSGRVWAPRPHMITLVMTAVWAFLLDRHRRQESDRIGLLWWLPPLMLLWANSHGGAIVGFLLLGIEIAGLLLHALWYRAFSGLWERTRALLIAGLLCLVAATVNPQGPRLLLFPFQTLGSQAQQDMIAEWASPDFHALDLLPFLALLLATWSALAWSRAQVPAVEWLRLAAFTAMALRSGRYLGLCAIVAAPLLVRHGARAWQELGRHWERAAAPPRARHAAPLQAFSGVPLLNWAILIGVLVAAAAKVALPLTPQTIAQVHEEAFPAAAVAYMREHGTPPTLFNEYAWGGYLLWELFPEVSVFIDGRADPYGDELIAAYRRTIMAQRGWDQVLDRYDVHTALIGADSSLASVMRVHAAWQEVYADRRASVFVRQ
ncbi:MAG TPA: hypothetical protein VM366_21170 [Anaerolineae bacterium]|nr:hypothetical protein [Anaerolineae bacterium]